MRSVILMFNPVRIGLSLVLLLMGTAGFTQVNSPYSRFGIGDLYDSRNMTSKGMAGLSTPYTDIQSVNFNNPASYTGLGFVTFDLGIEMEYRILANQDKTQRFESGNMIVNYAAMGVPLMKDKKKEKTLWAMAFGLRPLSRIRYNVFAGGNSAGGDSIQTEFRGDGGLYRAFLGTGFKIGGLSLGVNAGYVFGQRKLSTYRSIVDSVFYFTGALEQIISISDFVMDAGMQYEIKPTKKSTIRIGATGFLGGDVEAERNRFSQTVFFNNFGNADSIDVVANDYAKGALTLPAGYSLGISYETAKNLMLGAEYETTMWSEAGSFAANYGLGDTRRLRFGGQWIPDVMSSRNYWKQIMYRTGFFTGKDYVVVDGHQLPVWGVSFGAGIPIRRYSNYSTQFNTINLSFEYGRRGNGESPYVERYFRVGFGVALSDVWFIKRQYD